LRGCGTASPTPCFALSLVSIKVSLLCLHCISVGKEPPFRPHHTFLVLLRPSRCASCLLLILTQYAAMINHHIELYLL
jgi:hypothetical protein